jgi:predicted Zn finger-like uncharacterized protein
MALATQCPHCHTTFRVAQDQLKLRAGLVRCGHCKEIFNGIEHLLPPTAKLAPAASPAPSPSKSVSAPLVAPAVAVPTAVPAAAPPAEPHDEIDQTFASLKNAGPEAAKAAEEVETHLIGPETPVTSPPSPMPDVAAVPAPIEQETVETKKSEPTPPQARPDPLQRMTLIDFTHELPDDLEAFTDYPTEQLSHTEAQPGDQPDELEEAIRDLQNKPWRSKKKTARRKKPDPIETDEELDEEEEPGFLKRGRRQQRLGRHLRLAYTLGSVVLLFAALLQGAYAFRNQLAGSFPQSKPMLAQLCTIAGCRIDLPAQISSVSIESSELQTLASAKNKFVLNSLLRNYSATPQEWPYIELTLNDANEKPLLRRVFKPAEYLVNRDEVLHGFPPNSERAIKINFALSQIQASGYRVYLFYP